MRLLKKWNGDILDSENAKTSQKGSRIIILFSMCFHTSTFISIQFVRHRASHNLVPS